eukprot:6492790-Amphidinium_carterae.4
MDGVDSKPKTPKDILEGLTKAPEDLIKILYKHGANFFRCQLKPFTALFVPAGFWVAELTQQVDGDSYSVHRRLLPLASLERMRVLEKMLEECGKPSPLLSEATEVLHKARGVSAGAWSNSAEEEKREKEAAEKAA